MSNGLPPSAWRPLLDELQRDVPFLITTHANPEADAVGASLGLYYLLQKLGRRARIVLEEPLYDSLKYLDPDRVCRSYLPERRLELLPGEVHWLLDAGYMHRLGKLEEPLRAHSMRRLCLDHHVGNGDGFDVALIDTGASSTGLLVAELWDACGVTFTLEAARVLYSAIATDTGWYRFSNTDGRTLRMAARFLDMGVSSEAAYGEYREFRSWPAMRVIVAAMQTLAAKLDGRLALFYITEESIRREGISYSELEGVVEVPRIVRDVEVIALVVELSPTRCKLNFRSKGGVDVNKIAGRFGGGGHVRAAGAKVEMPLPQVLERIEWEVAQELAASHRSQGNRSPDSAGA